MSKLADYLRDWAGVLGEGNTPVLKGVIKGSVLMKTVVAPDRKHEAHVRVLEAKSNPDSSAAKFMASITKNLCRDGYTAFIEDRNGCVIYEFPVVNKTPETHKEVILHDTGTIDGVIIGVAGKDDTAHIRIQESKDRIWSVSVRDFVLARRLAQHFRSDPIRLIVHGSWKRNAQGIWEPNHLTAEDFEELDQSSVTEIFEELRAIPDNGWIKLDSPIEYWEDLRGSS